MVEPKLTAGAIVRRYQAHGIQARLHRDTIFVLREGGWEGPFAAADLAASHLEDIDRLEGDARTAAVGALIHEANHRREFGVKPSMIPEAQRVNQVLLIRLLCTTGWDRRRSYLYAGVADRLNRRGELLREPLF